MINDIRANLPQIREALRELPGVIHNLSEQAASGQVRVKMDSPEISAVRRELVSQRKQRFWLIVAATAGISAALTYGLEASAWVTGPLVLATLVSGWLARPNAL